MTKAGDGAVHGVSILWLGHAESKPAPPLFIVSNSRLRPSRTADRKEERMSTLSHPEIIGLDVSRDWLGIHCPADSRQLRLPNTDEGHSELESIAGDRNALVCFEAAGGCECRLRASLEAAGIPARQLPPAKTDRIDAELIACFMAFRLEAGRRLPSGKLCDLRTSVAARKQLVEMRKSAQLQNKASLKSGTADPVEDLVDEHLGLTARQIAEIEERIGSLLATDSGRMRGKRMIGGGRRALRQVLHQAALVASNRNKDLKVFAGRLRKEGKPHKAVADALCKPRQPWAAQTE